MNIELSSGTEIAAGLHAGEVLGLRPTACLDGEFAHII